MYIHRMVTSLSICIHVYIHIHIHLPLSLSIYIYIYQYLYLSLYISIYIYLSLLRLHQGRLQPRPPGSDPALDPAAEGDISYTTLYIYRSLGVVGDKIASAKRNPVQKGNTTTTPPTTTTTNNKGR